jgi:wobble nucleotide-excising tRNase
MIEKFLCIKNIGRFRDCKAAGDVAFRKVTLIYAENGRGKTTLCAILRSLQSGRPEPISERRTLGAKDPSLVQLRLNGTTVSFSNNTWTSVHPDIAIFDSVFVHENVYAGDYVDTEHRKKLYRVIIGEQGVALARRVDELDGQIREANKQINADRTEVERHIPKGLILEDFLKLRPLEDLDAKIRQKNKEIESIEHANEIAAKALLSKIPVPEFPETFETLLAQSLTDISSDAESRVKAHIAKCMDQRGETWLGQGLGYVRDDRCPFCGQDVATNSLLAAYRAYFKASYTTLNVEIASLEKAIKSSLQGEVILNVQKVVATNQALADFWRQFVPVDVHTLPFEEVQTTLDTLASRSLALIKQKASAPLDKVQPDPDFFAAMSKFNALIEAISSYNAAMDACNPRIAAQKELALRSDLNSANRDLGLLMATKQRFEPEVQEACRKYEKSLKEKSDLEAQKATAKKQLDEYCKDILVKYQGCINEYLDLFDAGFRITNTRHQYTGGTPRSQFQILINEKAIDLGDSRTLPGTPCFRTALSSGDRSALALAFFLASLKHDARIADKIVVFDDPLSSLDRFRRTCTQQLIRQQSKVAHQVIVLSHDPHFLKLVWDGYASMDVKTLQMTRKGDNTALSEWDVEAETQSEYLKDYNTLLTFYHDGSGNKAEVARSIRTFLEGRLRVEYPRQFAEKDWLGDFTNKIRSADASSPLNHAKADLAEIEAIKDYSKKYHHDQNLRADSEPISDAELRGYVKRALKLAGAC